MFEKLLMGSYYNTNININTNNLYQNQYFFLDLFNSIIFFNLIKCHYY